MPDRIGWAALGAVLAGVFSALAIGVSQLGRSPATTPDWTGSCSVARWPRVALLVGTLGWSAGWLWPVAGPVLAGWALVTIGIGAVVGSDRRPGTPGLVVVALGGLGLVLAGAALGGP